MRFLFIIILSLFNVIAVAQGLHWNSVLVGQGGGNLQNSVNELEMSKNDNYFIMHQVNSTFSIDTLTKSFGAGGIVITKFNSMDHVLWSKKIMDVPNQYGSTFKMTISNNEEILLYTSFRDSLKMLDTTIYSNGNYDILLVKFDSLLSKPKYLHIGNGCDEFVAKALFNSEDNIIVTGTIGGHQLDSCSVSLGVDSFSNIRWKQFLSKFDDNLNNYWNKTYPTDNRGISAENMILGKKNIYLIGSTPTWSNFNFDSHQFYIPVSWDRSLFIYKVDTAGNTQWVNAIGLNNSSFSDYLSTSDLDYSNNELHINVSAYADGSATLLINPGLSTNFTSMNFSSTNTKRCALYLRVDSMGNFISTHSKQGYPSISSTIATSINNSIVMPVQYFNNSYQNNWVFSGDTTSIQNPYSFYSINILDSNNTESQSLFFVDHTINSSFKLRSNSKGEVYFVGTLRNPTMPINFGNFTINPLLDELVIAKLTDVPGNSLSEIILSQDDDIKLYPNPFSSSFVIEGLSGQNATISIYNNIGLILKRIVNDQSTNVDLTKYPDGVYYILLENGKDRKMKKIVKMQ